MSKIDALEAQTSFLLEKQKEVAKFFKSELDNLYAFLRAEQDKAERAKAFSDVKSFEHVFSLLTDNEKATIGKLEEDLAFLEEQLAVLRQIAQIEDEEQAAEVMKMLLEDGYEPVETERFKADVENESEEARESFKAVTADIRDVFAEKGITELEALLEAHAAASEEECDEDEDEDDCSSSCCKSKSCCKR